MTVGILCIALLLVLIFLRLPIAFAMALIGAGGMLVLNGPRAAMGIMTQTTSEVAAASNLAVLPLFVLMGSLVTHSGMSQGLYRAAHAMVGHFRGGLAMATVLACGGFSTICGSSLATAATMTRLAMPEMREHKYADSLAAGSIAAGGTLGILIPPSIIMVIYGMLTGESVGKLFFAGILPGILTIVLYMMAIAIVTKLKPELGPPGQRSTWLQRLVAMRDVWGVALLFIVIMGGIYLGIFTPNEAAGVGAAGALVFALANGSLNVKSLGKVLLEAAEITSVMFLVLIGALIFANFMNEVGFAKGLTRMVSDLSVDRYVILLIIVAIYLVLGCFFESISMIMLTVPIFYPVMQSLGFDMIWFGILVVVLTEIGMITPPIGLNLFVIKSVMPDVATNDIIRGVVPFLGADMVRLALLICFPAISLFLPSIM
ncbi:MAG: TRAP transporter large permease [Betaproteobacteria bacterium]|jgi:C4-dicarboxylate transporter, DctM subunit